MTRLVVQIRVVNARIYTHIKYDVKNYYGKMYESMVNSKNPMGQYVSILVSQETANKIWRF